LRCSVGPNSLSGFRDASNWLLSGQHFLVRTRRHSGSVRSIPRTSKERQFGGHRRFLSAYSEDSHLAGVKFCRQPLKLIGASDVTALFGPIRQRGHQAQAANVRRVISAVFNWARGERGSDGEYLGIDNPVTRTKPIKIEREDEDIDPFSLEEIPMVVGAAREGWERSVVIVAVGTGLRPNENFGLKRANVDLDARVIRVRQTFSRFGEGGLKTSRSRRDVDLSEPVFEALLEHLAKGQSRSTWLWPVSLLHPLPRSPQQFSSKTWPAILKRAGVKHREFYQCRHTFATLLLSAGADWRYIADQMGHTDLTMLQKHYWKWRPGTIPRPAIDAFTEVLSVRQVSDTLGGINVPGE
jgi:integrase